MKKILFDNIVASHSPVVQDMGGSEQQLRLVMCILYQVKYLTSVIDFTEHALYKHAVIIKASVLSDRSSKTLIRDPQEGHVPSIVSYDVFNAPDLPYMTCVGLLQKYQRPDNDGLGKVESDVSRDQTLSCASH